MIPPVVELKGEEDRRPPEKEKVPELFSEAALAEGSVTKKFDSPKQEIAVVTPRGSMDASEKDDEGSVATFDEKNTMSGRWTADEHDRFLEGLELFGRRKWGKIAEHVQTRTVIQVRSHAQKYFKKRAPPADGFALLAAAAHIVDGSDEPPLKRPRTIPPLIVC